MAVPLKKVLAKMSPERRARIEAEARRIIDEELTLRDLRKAHQMTQEKLAALLGVKQESVSNLEDDQQNSCRHRERSSPRPSMVASTDLYSAPALPSSSGWTQSISGSRHDRP